MVILFCVASIDVRSAMSIIQKNATCNFYTVLDDNVDFKADQT